MLKKFIEPDDIQRSRMLEATAALQDAAKELSSKALVRLASVAWNLETAFHAEMHTEAVTFWEEEKSTYCVRFPVPVPVLADACHIRIEKGLEESALDGAFHRISFYSQEGNPDTKEQEVYLCLREGLTPSYRRYEMAVAVGRYLLHGKEGSLHVSHYNLPIPVSQEELAIEVFAFFLLVPPKLFLRELGKYIKDNSGFLKHFLEQVADKAVIPYAVFTKLFAYMMQLFCYISDTPLCLAEQHPEMTFLDKEEILLLWKLTEPYEVKGTAKETTG